MRQEILNEKLKTMVELLRDSDGAENPIERLQWYMKKDGRIKTVLGYALNPNFKMPLPEGIPPYIPSQHPIGIAPLEVLHTHNKLYIMYSKDTKSYKKEEIFIQWIEDMAPEEAEIMIAIKDQTLPTLFKNLTLDVFITALGWSREQYDEILKKRHAAA